MRQALVEITQAAGALAMDYFRPGTKTSASVAYKSGHSPVTEADHRVDAFLKQSLQSLGPDIGWLSEETIDTRHRLSCERVFIVDPIDGTRAFMAGDTYWGVSVALVKGGEPVIGVFACPARGQVFWAEKGVGAFCNGQSLQIQTGGDDWKGRISGPIPMIHMLERAGGDFDIVGKIPSLAYRLVLVAAGGLDIGLARENSHEWDIAAADLIVREAGGAVLDLKGEAIVYNRPDPRLEALLVAERGRAQRLLNSLLRRA